jgi:hypothetical protein
MGGRHPPENASYSMASASGPRPGTYLPTGWPIVGAGADRIAERAMWSASADGIREGGSEDTLYAVEFTTSPTVRGRPTVETVLDAVTAEIRGRCGPALAASGGRWRLHASTSCGKDGSPSGSSRSCCVG